jgi:hypothetical protein
VTEALRWPALDHLFANGRGTDWPGDMQHAMIIKLLHLSADTLNHPLFRGWRRELVGNHLSALKKGEKYLVWAHVYPGVPVTSSLNCSSDSPPLYK